MVLGGCEAFGTRGTVGRLLRAALRPGFWSKLSAVMMLLPLYLLGHGHKLKSVFLPLRYFGHVFLLHNKGNHGCQPDDHQRSQGFRDSESGTVILSYICKVGRHLQVALTMECQPLSTRSAQAGIHTDGVPAWF